MIPGYLPIEVTDPFWSAVVNGLWLSGVLTWIVIIALYVKRIVRDRKF